ncbi:MAG: hypothetical protein ACPGJS_07000, partial [Flammeovirgaceae bacterium]
QAIYDQIQEETPIQLLPINTLEGKLKYTRMGYPIASVRKAAKVSDHKQFVSIIVQVTGTQETVTGGDFHFLGNEDVQVERETITLYPIFNIRLQFGDENGKKGEEIVGVFQGNEEITINSRVIILRDIILQENVTTDEIPYELYLKEAIKDLVKKLNQ